MNVNVFNPQRNLYQLPSLNRCEYALMPPFFYCNACAIKFFSSICPRTLCILLMQLYVSTKVFCAMLLFLWICSSRVLILAANCSSCCLFSINFCCNLIFSSFAICSEDSNLFLQLYARLTGDCNQTYNQTLKHTN